MIAFVTSYDEPTRANRAVFELLRLPERHTALLDGDATAAKLSRALGASEVPLVVMSHGTHDSFREHGGNAAFSIQSVGLCRPRSAFVFACRTAIALGRTAAEAGWTWWGYNTRISAPSTDMSELGLFAGIFQFVVDTFAVAADFDARHAFLVSLRERCDEARAELDSLAVGGSLPSMDSYICLEQIWERLEAHVAGGQQPERHPEGKAVGDIILGI